MDWAKLIKDTFEKIGKFWLGLSVKKKVLTVSGILGIVIIISTGAIIKAHFDNKNLSPQMLQFKKDGTMFIEVPAKVSENNNHLVYIKGRTAPKANVRIGYGILGDTTTSDSNGKFTLSYDDNLQQKTNIKITAQLNGKQISRIVTVLPSPKVQQKIRDKNKQIKHYKKISREVENLTLKDKSFSDAKSMILGISSSIDINSESNNKEITDVTDSDKVTDVQVNQTDTGVSVLLYLEPSDSAKKALAEKKAEKKKEQDILNARNEYMKKVVAYEVQFNEYAIEYLIDMNTSTIYERTTDDSSISQSKFTGDMDTRIDFDLDGLQMIAYHRYVGNDSVAYFNDETGNSNKAYKTDTETTKNLYFKSLNLPF